MGRIVWESVYRADGSNIIFPPPPVNEYWLIDAVVFAWNGFPIATHFYAAQLLRSGVAVANYPYGDPVGDSTVARSVSMPITASIVVFPGQQLTATYGAGAAATGWTAEIRGLAEDFSYNARSLGGASA